MLCQVTLPKLSMWAEYILAEISEQDVNRDLLELLFLSVIYCSYYPFSLGPQNENI